MRNQMLHVFRNTPLGKQTFLQSIYFSRVTGFHLKVFIPTYRQFLMYFQKKLVTVDLDKSYLRSPKTAKFHAEQLIAEEGTDAGFLTPEGYTASVLPDIPVDFGMMCCPRSMSDLSAKIGLGYIGPKVRSIINNAGFSVLIPKTVFREWKSIVVFLGGSANALRAFRLGRWLQEKTGFPLRIYTYSEGKPQTHYQKLMEENGIYSLVESLAKEWIFRNHGMPLKDAFYDIPSDALLVAGAYEHSGLKDVLFGSMLEQIQTILPNNMLIVGPNYVENVF